MFKTIYQVYRNGEAMKSSKWFSKELAMDAMADEIACEMEELQRSRPDSDFMQDIDEHERIGVIDEYCWDENHEKGRWKFDVSKYEVKEIKR